MLVRPTVVEVVVTVDVVFELEIEALVAGPAVEVVVTADVVFELEIEVVLVGRTVVEVVVTAEVVSVGGGGAAEPSSRAVLIDASKRSLAR